MSSCGAERVSIYLPVRAGLKKLYRKDESRLSSREAKEPDMAPV